MHAETTLTLDIDDVGPADSDVYCEFCGDENAEPHVYDLRVDALEGLDIFALVVCHDCLLAFVKRQYPWAHLMECVK